MPNINKILSKVNQAKSAVSSAKGIKSKLSSINYTSVINSNELEAQAEIAKQTLDKRKASLQKSLDANNTAKNKAKKSPDSAYIELQYPRDELHDNYIVFRSRQRINRQRRSEDGKMKQATGVGMSADSNRASLMNTADSQVEIALHIPLTLESDAAVKYSAKDVGSLARGVQQGGVGGFVSGMIQGLSQAASKLLNSMTGNAMFIMQGKAVNPMQEMALEGVDFRELSFSYTMSPSSKEEADMINEIIYYFKTAMLPDTYPALGAGSSDAEGFFNYPNTWEAILEGPIAEKVDGYLPMVLKGRVHRASLSYIDYILFVFVFFLMVFLAFLPITNNEIVFELPAMSIFFAIRLFLSGIIAAIAMIIPGLSGSLILLVMGMYDVILLSVVNLALVPLSFFFLGALVSLVSCTQVIQVCFKRYSSTSYFMIAALLLGSCFSLFPGGSYAFTDWFFAILIFLLTLLGLYFFEKLSSSSQGF